MRLSCLVRLRWMIPVQTRKAMMLGLTTFMVLMVRRGGVDADILVHSTA